MKIDEEWLDNFFRPVDEKNILKRRESTGIEFKECFNWGNKEFKSNIGKSAAAFSNNAGGVIIFGIGNNPHKLIGLESFEIDEADISHSFNEHFSPYIDFSLHTCEIAGKTIGLMQVYEAKKKPVICIKDSPKTNDSDIYFRYNAKSSKIKSGDLNHLINQIQESNNKKWLDLFTKVSTVGISNISLLNKVTGEMDSPGTAQKFLLDESLLDQIKILDRHSVSEIGAPAVRIVGEIVETTSVINRTKSLHEEDIFKALLSSSLECSPSEYLSIICRLNSEFYPIYWLLNHLTPPDTESRIKFIESEIVSRSRNKPKIIRRIADDSQLEKKYGKYSLLTEINGLKRKLFFDKLVSQENSAFETDSDCKDFLEAIFSLNQESTAHEFVISELKRLFEEKYPFEKDSLNYLFRWAVSFIDNLFFKGQQY